MSDFSAFYGRMNAKGSSHQESVSNSTKRQAYKYFMNSLTLSYVSMNSEQSTSPSIVSDIETYHKRSFLFLPDSNIRVGDYIKHKDFTYLATDHKMNEIYPELIGMLCNNNFSVKTVITKVLVGRDPNTNRPFYEDVEEDVFMPCVVKYQSFLSNEARFLIPKGRLEVSLKYDSTFDLSLNRKISMYDNKYTITDVDLTKTINGNGIATIVCEVTT